MKRTAFFLSLLALTACAGARTTTTTTPVIEPDVVVDVVSDAPEAIVVPPAPQRTPPVPGPARTVELPAIQRTTLPNGLELNIVPHRALPILQLRLLVRNAGSSADPPGLPGLASFTGDLLKEGTRQHTGAQIVEAIEFVGGSLSVTTTQDATTLALAVPREHAEIAVQTLAEIVSTPAFLADELEALRQRELDRLTQALQDPEWLARETLLSTIYGNHPYNHVDARPASVRRFQRSMVQSFHQSHYLANAMVFTAIGDVREDEFRALATRLLGRIRRGALPQQRFPTPANPTQRTLVLVDRPGSAQSVLRVANVGLRRTHDAYVPFSVANHVLGGEASSRLFMELRERRSLTYGAYSAVQSRVEPGLFLASSSVRTPVTGEAVGALLHELERIRAEVPTENEFSEAQRYLIDSFALSSETAAHQAGLVSDLRLFGLPDQYWNTFRTRIAGVTREQALEQARAVILPDRCVIVVVGAAAEVQSSLQRYGAVRVVDANGTLLRELPATTQ